MSSLLIYSASAGSGKTFTLTRKYLEVLLKHPNNYRRILAVTFTNKAAAEMKERVLKELVLLRDHPLESDHLEDLAIHLQITHEQVSQRANESLNRLLNDYSHMAIGTIDSFFQILLRSFARETGITSGFSLELDADKVVAHVIDKLIREAGSRPDWLFWLRNWIEFRMDQGEGWSRLHTELVKMGKELLREEILVYALARDSGLSNPDQVNQVIQTSSIICKSFEDQLSYFSLQTVDMLHRHGLEIDDFKGKKGSPLAKMTRLKPDSFEPTATFNTWADEMDSWVTKTLDKDRRSTVLSIVSSELQPLLAEFLDFYQSRSNDYFSAKVVLKNIYAFGLAVGFFELLNKYGEENEIFLISLTNPFLKRIINENPTPFLYEKSGNHYKHFLIDEFQDTSSQQWDNLIPLISNSLSENGLGMIVGDVKQSIYRWRNSNWRLLADKAAEDMAAFGIQPITLEQNFRSSENIISFNNDLFGSLPELLKSTITYDNSSAPAPGAPHDPDWISKAYANNNQTPGKSKDGGRVQLEFLGIDQTEFEFHKEASNRLISIIEDLQQKQGYKPYEISILVRRKKDAVILSGVINEYLSRSNAKENVSYQLVSPDTYSLGSSPAILLLVSFLHYINQPDEVYYEGIFDLEFGLHLKKGIPPDFQHLGHLASALKKEGASWRTLPLTQIIHRSITSLGLDQEKSEIPYIFSLLDFIKEIEHKEGGHLQGFLDWWNENGISKTVVMDTDPSSMQIFTIHKAKGLQFPVVIIPFTNWTLENTGFNKSLLWVPTENTPFNRVPVLPIPYSSALKNTCFRDFYHQEKLEQVLDALNLLYVSSTRPMEHLYLICPNSDSRKRRISDYLFKLFENRLNDEYRYILEEKESLQRQVSTETTVSIPLVIDRMITSEDDFEIRTSHLMETPAIRSGVFLHTILEEMVEINDFNLLLNRYLKEGKITRDEWRINREILEKVCMIPLVREWFSGEWEVKSESELLVPGGGVKRPDRIMIQQDLVVVVDYKTGKTLESHKNQILDYCNLLSDMGYRQITGYLLYLQDALLVKVS